MFKKYLILFFINSLIEELKGETIKRYHCDTKDKINEVKNIRKYLKRFIGYHDKIYFVLNKRTIFTKIPLDDNNSDYDTKIVNHVFYEQKNQEKKPSEISKKKYSVFGHIYSYNLNLTEELYFNNSIHDTVDVTDLLGHSNSPFNTTEYNRIYEKSYLLNFNHKIGSLAHRSLSKSTNDFSTHFPIINELNKLINTKYFFAVRCGNFTNWKRVLYNDLILKYNLDKNRAKKELVFIQLSESINLSDSKRKVLIEQTKRFDLLDKSKSQFFSFYFKSNEIETINQKHHINLIDISDNFKIKFANYLYDSSIDAKNYKKINEFKIDFDELFNCHTPIKNNQNNQLKGIYYDKNKEKFYLIIKRFYLVVNSEYFLNGWSRSKLNDEFYLKNSIDLDFGQDIYLTGSYFNENNQNWIKTLGTDRVLFTMDNMNFYDLKTDQNKLKFEWTNLKLTNCSDQILLIEDHLFCFMQTQYYHMYKQNEMSNYAPNHSNNSISLIFKNSSIDYEDTEIVKFIFNYKNGFVLMTLKNQYLFDYNKFKIIDNQIVSLYKSKDEYVKIENCIFSRFCKSDHISISEANSSSSNEIKDENVTTEDSAIFDDEDDEDDDEDKTEVTDKEFMDEDDKLLIILFIGVLFIFILVITFISLYLKKIKRDSFDDRKSVSTSSFFANMASANKKIIKRSMVKQPKNLKSSNVKKSAMSNLKSTSLKSTIVKGINVKSPNIKSSNVKKATKFESKLASQTSEQFLSLNSTNDDTTIKKRKG